MSVVLNARTIRTVRWSNHQSRRILDFHELPTIIRILPPKLIKRHILNLFFHFLTTLPQITSILATKDLQTIIKLVQLAVIVDRGVGRSILEYITRLQRPCATGVQCHHRHEWHNKRQTEPNMHGLVHMIIALTQRPRKETLYRTSKKVLLLGNIPTHIINGVRQHFCDATRALRSLRRILRDVLHYCPQIQTGPPIDVSEVRQQHMILVRTTEFIVARHAKMPLTLAITLLECAEAPAHPRSQRFDRKTITTNRTALLTTRTGVLAILRPLFAMNVMPGRLLYQRSDQASQWLKIHLLLFLTFLFPERILQQPTETSPLRPPVRHGALRSSLGRLRSSRTIIVLNIMSSNFFIPIKTTDAIFRKTWIPC